MRIQYCYSCVAVVRLLLITTATICAYAYVHVSCIHALSKSYAIAACRYEFLEALIRIAAAKFVYPAANAAAAASAAVSTATSMVKQYITAPAAPAVLDPLTGLNHGKVHGVHVPDLSEAVGTLLCRHIVPLAERCDARTWLRDRFLLEAADSLYTKYLPSLQKAFDAHSLGE